MVFESEDKSAHLRMEQILYRTLETGLRMLAPFMPYLCEELYQRLPGRLQTESICIASYPQPAEVIIIVVVILSVILRIC